MALLAMFFNLFQLSASNLRTNGKNGKKDFTHQKQILRGIPGLTPAVVELNDLIDTGRILEPLPLVLSHLLRVASLTITTIRMCEY